MDLALERQAFYDYEGLRYERHFRRDAETTFDFVGRSKRIGGFLRQCVEKLCAHLYSPGPARRWSEDAGDEFLQTVWKDNLLNSLMLEADKLSTLNGWCGIQIDAGSTTTEDGTRLSDYTNKPITYRVWGREQLCVWTDPESASTPQVVCTKDAYDAQIRYRLWSDTEVWTFLTNKQPPAVKGGIPTSDGNSPVLRFKEKHDYGVLPFTFIHYDLPIRCFETVSAGEFLWKAGIHIDDRLMRLDEAINKHMNPVPWAKNVPETWKPIVQPMRFIRLPGGDMVPTDNGFEVAEGAELGFLQAMIDVASAWDDLSRYIRQCLAAVGMENEFSMEQIDLASGVALMLKQEPLIKRSENRRTTFAVYEEDLAKRTLICAGNHYGKPELVSQTELGHLTAGWPRPRLAVVTTDILDVGIAEVQNGLKSHLMLIQDTYGIGRDEALALLEQMKEDDADVAKIMPEVAAVNAPQDPQEAADQEHQRNLEAIAAKGEQKGKA